MLSQGWQRRRWRWTHQNNQIGRVVPKGESVVPKCKTVVPIFLVSDASNCAVTKNRAIKLVVCVSAQLICDAKSAQLKTAQLNCDAKKRAMDRQKPKASNETPKVREKTQVNESKEILGLI